MKRNYSLLNCNFKQIKDITRQIKKAVVAGNLRELQKKSMEKFGKASLPRIHLDSDGTEIDDEDYFQTLEPNTELIAVFIGEQWVDPTQYLTITTHNSDDEGIESGDVEKVHLKKLISLLKTNLCNVSILSEPDLELLSNLDPNSVADVITKDYVEQLKEASGRVLDEKREAFDTLELLKLIGKHQGIGKQNSTEHRPFSPSSSTTSLSTMSSFSSNNQQ
ncbi:CLUMA_CG002973, isoform A [Clunio marinus]|uniref:CLUMA_CG002973, isoform A n=1 Tax=Clunio marinus TaxID=568069 RepID=A0A1J1HRV6_9DIPT|nr:CLUMA_CG002973, isoform A [Clunio marinus]